MSRVTDFCTSYRPGETNINQREARSRRESGILSVLFALILFAFLLIIGAPTIVYGIMLVPIWFAFMYYLQSNRYFCVNFALRGIHNARRAADMPQNIVSETAKKKDKAKAQELLLIVTASSAFVTIVLMFAVDKM